MKRICSTCGIEKILSPEFFYRHRYSKGGYRGSCKDCVSKQDSRGYARRRNGRAEAEANLGHEPLGPPVTPRQSHVVISRLLYRILKEIHERGHLEGLPGMDLRIRAALRVSKPD